MKPLAWGLVAATVALLSGVREMRIPDPTRFWLEGEFHELVPSIRLPTTHDGRDVIRVWMRFPEDGRIDVLPGADPVPVYPAGTRLDRTEYLRIEEGMPRRRECRSTGRRIRNRRSPASGP